MDAMQTTKNVNRHRHSIDFAKGVCILFVIITHYAWNDTERLKYLFPFWLDMAVPVFMVISGWVYTKSFKNNGINTIDKAYAVDFVLKRTVRYSIPFAIMFLIEEISFSDIRYSFAETCISFLRGGYGPGSYYYPIMIQFIFWFPVIYFIIQKNSFRGLILCGFINFIYEVLVRAYGMHEECYRLLVFRYTLLIAYGCYLAMCNHKRHRILALLLFFTGITYIIACIYVGFVPPITKYWTGTSFLASFYIIPVVASMILNNVSNSFIETLGRASYNVFLVQMAYYYRFAEMIYKHIQNKVLQLTANLAICIVLGIVFYYFETPITKRVNELVCGIWGTQRKQQL